MLILVCRPFKSEGLFAALQLLVIAIPEYSSSQPDPFLLQAKRMEIMKEREEIYFCPEVQSVCKLIHYLDVGNYVGYFQAAKRAPYLIGKKIILIISPSLYSTLLAFGFQWYISYNDIFMLVYTYVSLPYVVNVLYSLS